jgi:cytosine/adenosine deaminase-related metal-dependent hydrolase
MHVAESELENELTLAGRGAIAETFEKFGVTFAPTGERLIPTLQRLGLVRSGAQFVHCCAVTPGEVGALARAGVTVAHCPRSNTRLGCPPAPVREMLDAGIAVGLGLDSPASSGRIDMFDEMREAMRVALARGRPVSPEEVWSMATTMGAASIRAGAPQLPVWEFRAGELMPPAIQITVDEAYTTDDLIEQGSPDAIAWFTAST